MRHLSVFESDSEILNAISDIHLKGWWFDLDCTYSKGVFWKGCNHPKFKSDIDPINEEIIKSDSRNLDFLTSKVNSIVFDPPFLFRNRISENNDKMSKRFSYFNSYGDLLNMYFASLDEFKNRLNINGFVFFKCQDMTDNRFYCTHVDIINYATANGYILKDIIIKKSKTKLQRDAKQQSCVAKVHSYWLVLQFKQNAQKQEKLIKL